MTTEKIEMADFFQAVLNASPERGNRMIAALTAFQAGRKPRENRQFVALTRKTIAQRYMALRQPTWNRLPEDLTSERDLFVSIVESHGNGLAAICATLPPGQDERREKVRQLASALQRLQEVLVTIDSAALGQTLNEMDKALHGGTARHATDPGEAFMLAGELRRLGEKPLSAMIVGATTAAKVLVEPDYDPILEVIWKLERLFDEHGLPFEVKDSGFAAECVRAIYELADPKKLIGRPKYILSKAVSDPRSWANLSTRLRKKLP